MNVPAEINGQAVTSFADCENLEEVYILPCCTDIGEHAFDGCPSDMTIYCYSLSEADYLAIRLQCYVRHVDWQP